MRASFGEQFRLSIFGESHGPAIGIVLDGLPSGFPLDEEAVATQMARRAPGSDPTATARKEPDRVRIVSGIFEGRTTGAPLCGIIENTNTHSSDYSELKAKMRPGHSDYAAFVKYSGYNDVRGGGHFSGRITAPIVFAGSVARQLLAARGITVGSHILSIGKVSDRRFDPVNVNADTLDSLCGMHFPLLDASLEIAMREEVARAKNEADSVGGCIETAAVGVPAGIGSPFFGSVESVVSSLAYSVPAVKGVEFGDGFAMSAMTGIEANDAMRWENGHAVCLTNHNGGVTGGITNGMPVIFRAAVKPTPSIGIAQQTVDVLRQENAELCVHGRHDPCIVPRAAVVLESVLAIALAELMMDNSATRTFWTGKQEDL